MTLVFNGGALQVIDENLKIFGLNASVLGRPSEEIVRMLRYKLIERAEERRTAHEPTMRRPAGLPSANAIARFGWHRG